MHQSTLLFVILCTVSTTWAQTVSQSSVGAIDESEVRSWLEHELGWSSDCTKAINEIVASRILAADARETGLDKHPIVARKLRMLEAMAYRKLARQLISIAVEAPSDQEVAAHAEGRQFGVAKPARTRLQWIFRRQGADDSSTQDEARAFLEDLRQQILAGTLDFETAAREHSHSASRFRDGFVGAVTASEISPELGEIVLGMKDGELSEVISTSSGFHLFRVEKQIAASNNDLHLPKARQELFLKSRKLAWDRFKSEVLEAASPVYHLDKLTSADDAAIVLELASGETLSTAQTRDLAELDTELVDDRLREIAILMELPAAAKARGYELTEALQTEYRLRQQRRLATEMITRAQDARVVAATDEEIRAVWLEDRPRYQSSLQHHLSLVQLHVDDEGLIDLLTRIDGTSDELRTSILAEAGLEASERWLDDKDLIELGVASARTIRVTTTGEFLGPLRHGNDVWLVRILERRQPGQQPLEEVSERIGQELLAVSRQAEMMRLVYAAVARAELVEVRALDCDSIPRKKRLPGLSVN